jgi:cell division protein FtsB
MDIRTMTRDKVRSLFRSEDGLRFAVHGATQAEDACEKVLERLRPVSNRFYEERRRLATASVVVLTAWLLVHVVFGANGMVVYKQKRAEIRELRKNIEALQQENDRFSQDINALKTDPRAIEKEAREQLHYARPGEVVYVEPAPAPQQKPVTNSAEK